MRGTKRKRDTGPVLGSLQKGVVISESGESPPNTNGIVIGRSGDSCTTHGHADPAVGDPNRSTYTRASPVSNHISEGPTRWLELRTEAAAQLTEPGPKPIQARADHSNPASRQVGVRLPMQTKGGQSSWRVGMPSPVAQVPAR